MAMSDDIKGIYLDMYAGGEQAAWRNAGAKDKAGDILRLWSRATGLGRPRVVEIGCGEGAVAQALGRSDFFSSYQGFDLSPSGIAEATSRNIANATFTQMDGHTIPAESNSADVSILSHVVEHLEHPRQLIYEAARIAPFVIIEVPLEATLRMPRDYIPDDLGHINKYTATTIRQLVQTCGLAVVEEFTMNPSRQVQTFHDSSTKRKLEWMLKDRALRYFPSVARNLFVYHEAILASRQDQ